MQLYAMDGGAKIVHSVHTARTCFGTYRNVRIHAHTDTASRVQLLVVAANYLSDSTMYIRAYRIQYIILYVYFTMFSTFVLVLANSEQTIFYIVWMDGCYGPCI